MAVAVAVERGRTKNKAKDKDQLPCGQDMRKQPTARHRAPRHWLRSWNTLPLALGVARGVPVPGTAVVEVQGCGGAFWAKPRTCDEIE
jgi:hypothetical protein